MASFTDTAGRAWHLHLDAWAIKQVRLRTGVDLGRLFDDGFRAYVELGRDLPLLVDVIWVLVADQAAGTGATEEQFARSLGGDALRAAADALQDAIVFFCHKPQRELLTALMARAKAMEAESWARAMEAVAAAGSTATSSSSATNSPESSASIPPG